MIYVDKLFDASVFSYNNARAAFHGKRNKNFWCHMWSDTHNVEELIKFAKRLGLKTEWLQNKKDFPHFDLVPSKRILALKLGAKEIELTDWFQQQKTKIETTKQT